MCILPLYIYVVVEVPARWSNPVTCILCTKAALSARLSRPNGCESRRHAAMPPPAPVSPSSCCFRRRQRCSQHATDQPEKLP